MAQAMLDRSVSASAEELACLECGTHALLRLTGRLDGSCALPVIRRVRSLADDGVRVVVVDLSGVDATDGHGLAVLLRCRRVLRARAGVLVVRNAPPDAAATLRRAGLLLPQRRP